MSAYIDVPEFFSSIYLVDLSPSLCQVARKRFERLGWLNVKVICQDARLFRLEDHEGLEYSTEDARTSATMHSTADVPNIVGADLITLSYSLSMIVSFNYETQATC